MKKLFLLAAVLVGFMVPTASAQAYLHLDVATGTAKNWWNYNYDQFSRRDYRRFSDSRVDILGQGYRNGVWGCRWMIVRGSDASRYAVWHPDSSFNPGCGGV